MESCSSRWSAQRWVATPDLTTHIQFENSVIWISFTSSIWFEDSPIRRIHPFNSSCRCSVTKVPSRNAIPISPSDLSTASCPTSVHFSSQHRSVDLFPIPFGAGGYINYWVEAITIEWVEAITIEVFFSQAVWNFQGWVIPSSVAPIVWSVTKLHGWHSQ